MKKNYYCGGTVGDDLFRSLPFHVMLSFGVALFMAAAPLHPGFR